MIELTAGSARVLVDEEHGARIASLFVGDRERLLTGDGEVDDPLQWGAYPMVPYAGRVRHGRFAHDDVAHELPIRLGPHAIHGTVYDQPWWVLDHSEAAVALGSPLGPDWPWEGLVNHDVSLTDRSLTCRLTLRSTEIPFPGQVGWHPWFADGSQPPTHDFHATRMYRRDDDYMATGDLVDPRPHPWDDCFTGVTQPVTLHYADGMALRLTSDCDDWVVYEPDHALCVEPQSGPPDGFTIAPVLVTPDTPLVRQFTIAWG